MEHCEEISYARTGPVATISLNRPRARNAHTAGMADELADAFDRADRDEDVRAVVFTGESKDFCARIDSRLIAGLPANEDAVEGAASFLERRAPNFPGTVARDLPSHLPWVQQGAPTTRAS